RATIHMARKIIWSPSALNDLRDIVHFISDSSPERAETVGWSLIGRINSLQDFPQLGRPVPELVVSD
ncbi:MAG: type II toxin-antitoxin system RelE/ParE family toxin, partial [Armatimonadota bacterium]|nr:type II toxin-antitoxin system RelE/ParE family toxin [Armatimonadota bacterium]